MLPRQRPRAPIDNMRRKANLRCSSSAAYADPSSPIASCRQPVAPRRRITRGFIAAKAVSKKAVGERLASCRKATPSKNLFSQPRSHEEKIGHGTVELPETTPTTDTRSNEHDADQEEREDADNEQEVFAFDPYFFIKCLPDYGSVTARLRRSTALPKKTRRSKRISLVLDLDETLVHCSVEPLPNPDLVFEVELSGNTYIIYVLKRPYMEEFLREVSKYFEVIVFTASRKAYASKLLDLIDPGRRLIKYRLYRETCLHVEGNFLKDLNVLGRNLAHTIIVDNSPHAFGYQVSNGIPIESWFYDRKDTELVKLLPFLAQLLKAEDVRPAIRQKFQLHRLVQLAGR